MRNPWLVPVLLAASVAAPAKPSVAALQAQVKKLTAERDDLQERLAATDSLREDLAAAQKSRDLARQETEAVRKQLDQIKGALSENQGSSDALLKELEKAKAEAAASKAALQAFKDEQAKASEQKAQDAGKAVVALTPDIIPAKPMNLNKLTPRVKKVTGTVVVNVLISENGEVLDTRLLQGLPGQGEWVDAANEACVEAAKRIVFDPARTADGQTRVRVWQGVGFFLD